MHQEKTQNVMHAGDALVRVSDFRQPALEDFKSSDTLVILIHGFTSNGTYLTKLGNTLRTWEAQAFLFNYNSYRGISLAGDSLEALLLDYDRLTRGEVRRRGVYLVGHSMGGLVARKFALGEQGKRMVRGIVMLGTPSDGAFTHANILQKFVDLGEYLTGPMPGARSPTCLSAKELMKSDDNEHPYIDRLNEAWRSSTDCPPTLSISGGRRFLSFSGNSLKNRLANRSIQHLIGSEPNDGLVTEPSVNMCTLGMSQASHSYSHHNSYPDYPDINHTYLIQDQSLALFIRNWIRDTSTPVKVGSQSSR